MADYAIHAENISKKFGHFLAVNRVNLHIPSGRIYGFLGPNGSGKSTTIRMLTGLLVPSEGTISVLGLSLPKQAEALRLKIGYMTQKFSLYADLTVQENLRFVARIFGFTAKQEKQRVDAALAEYGLNQKSHQLAGGLSGGQKQRLALAAATLHSPKLLFLDEPTSAVDPENRRDFWEKLFDLCEQDTTVLVSTHYMDEAERCHALAILEAGEVRADGAPEQLMKNMHANVLEIAGENLRCLKQEIVNHESIISAAQQGLRLRVLIDEQVQNPIQWLQSLLPGDHLYQITEVRPSLEDVFVRFTGEGRQ